MSGLGKTLLLFGAIVAAVGLLLMFAGRVPGLSRIGRLPGDISVERGNFRFYFPLATSIVLSVAVSLLFWILGRR
jgi:hypothetical protein